MPHPERIVRLSVVAGLVLALGAPAARAQPAARGAQDVAQAPESEGQSAAGDYRDADGASDTAEADDADADAGATAGAADGEDAGDEAGEGADADADGDDASGARGGTGDDAQAPDAPTFYGTISGEYQLRGNGLTTIPLAPLTADGVTSRALGQHYWLEQWIRVRAELGIRPSLKLTGQLDLLNGVVAGDLAQGVGAGERARDDYTAFSQSGVRPRWLYLDWLTPVGLVRVGAMGSQWGLGILANDGDHPPPFGDYRYGDLVARVAFATRPLGRTSPFVVALAGDYVLDDITANAFDDEDAFQAVLAAYYEKDERHVGLYGVYRTQENAAGDYLHVLVGDVHARWDALEPSGGRVFADVEAAYVHGTTTLTRSIDRSVYDVRQLMVVGQLGRHTDRLDIVFEGGYASGDSNALDGTQRRATIDPDHRVGLVLFPEVLAAMTARSGTLAASPELVGRPPPGSELLPSNGGVQGAMYLFPYVEWRPKKWIEARLGAVLARATSAVVDPYEQRARSHNVNYRGGDATARDLGFELDASVLLRGDIATGVTARARQRHPRQP